MGLEKKYIYLDHNSTTPLKNEVVALYRNLYNSEIARSPLNASSIHKEGQVARKLLSDARLRIASAINLNHKTHEIVFTSSGTESNHIVLSNILSSGGTIVCSSIEHASVYYNAAIKINLDHNGGLDLNHLDMILHKLRQQNNESPILVSVMAANNETGLIHDIKTVSQIAKKYNCLVHSDCSQALGKIPFDFQYLDIDLATISSHKIGGPHGISGLVMRKRIISNSLLGGGQEGGVRHGSENILGAIGFALATELAVQQQEKYATHTTILKKHLEGSLARYREDIPSLQGHYIVHSNYERLPNTSMIVIEKDIDPSLLIAMFDAKNIGISNGSACSSGTAKTNYVLQNIIRSLCIKSLSTQDAFISRLTSNITGIRVSFGQTNTLQDVDCFLAALNEIRQIVS